MSTKTKQITLKENFFGEINNNEHFKLLGIVFLFYFSLLMCLYFVLNALFMNETLIQNNYNLSQIKTLTPHSNLAYIIDPSQIINNNNILLDNSFDKLVFIASEKEKEKIIASIKKEREIQELEKIKAIEAKKYTIKGYSVITAYSSDIYQCDSTPCITANGFNVCDHGEMDTIAANHLRFGTKVKIPDIFGDRVFIVRDRMNRRYKDRIDVWMTSKNDAKEFGVKLADIHVRDQ